MNNELERTNTNGYYSNSSNIIQTLVDCLYDTAILLGKSSIIFWKWLMDGWIDFNNDKEDIIKFENYSQRFFDNANLKIKDELPTFIEKGEMENYYYFIYSIPLGMCVSDFEKQTERFSIFFGCDEDDIRFTQINNNLEIQIMKPRKTYLYDPIKYKRNDFKIPMGYDRKNNIILLDLLASKNFGCYAAGSSGGGKSKTVRLILTHLINNVSKEDLELVLIDTKCVDLSAFKSCKHTILYQRGTKDIEEHIKKQYYEMNRRYEKILEPNDYEDIWEAREENLKIPFRLIVIEELSAYQGNTEFHKYLKNIAERGRAAGIMLLCTCQFPNKDVLPSVTKCNFNCTLGHKTINELTSEVIAGKNSGLEKLKGNGHNKMFCVDYQGVEYQSLLVTKQTMKEVIKNTR